MRLLLALPWLVSFAVASPATNPPAPVTPHASPEARQLLEYLHAVSGHRTLVGQHNQPLFLNTLSIDAAGRSRDRAALYGQDFGFDARETLDDITLRQRNIDLIIQEHRAGSIITLMWHAVRPIDEEPMGWRESVQAELTDDQWRELITPGTEIHERWQAQVDVIAWFLKQLQRERIPVIWRPYHEMNGSWFWWGDKRGPDGYARLYRMLFERLVQFHRLDNLIWCFNGNEIGRGNGDYALYYPGHDVVDVLATDVYRGNFDLVDYVRLLQLAEGRPIALGEVGVVPTEAVLAEQPRWAWFMTWATFHYRIEEPVAQAVYTSPRTLTRSEVDLAARDFPPLPPAPPAAAPAPADVPPPATLPEGFVALSDVAPTIRVDLQYAGEANVTGTRLAGYERNRAILTRAAAQALRRAQAELYVEGLGLKVVDAYRPQSAVAHLIRWSQDPTVNPVTQARHHPHVLKAELFARGYLALESAHSRGSAIDATLVQRQPDGLWVELDLGTPVDYFGPEAGFDHAGLTPEQRQWRTRLRAVLEKYGFASYDQEWWHFTLRDEPFPEQYFDFPVR